MPSQPIPIKRLSLLYKFYFLYFDPLMALIGATLITSNAKSYLQSTIPSTISSLHPLTITPAMQLMLTNIASLYVLIAILQGVVLRLTRERNVWRGILAALLVSDLGHVYAIYEAAPERWGGLGGWTQDEWFGNGILAGGAAVRMLFLLGVGWE